MDRAKGAAPPAPALVCLAMAATLSLQGPVAHAALPAGFTEQTINRPDGQAWNEAVGLAFSPTGRLFVWERGGSVWVVDAANPLTSRFIDLRDEVAAYSDHGMLGLALHPNFNANGYLYVLYVTERHHLENCDSPRDGPPQCGPGYVPGTHIRDVPTIGRVVRYQATRPAGDVDYSRATGIDPASRRVLMGESYWRSDAGGTDPSKPRNTGCPLLHYSHGVGSLVFGQDGTLLVSCGESASPGLADIGPGSDAYHLEAVAAGIMRPAEDVGAFRSQMIDSLAGKLLRIDPDTGDGVPSNPFYDPDSPRAARSRVWALGLRNPFRFALRPESGSHEPLDGDPGTLMIGDVGWNQWEELDVAQAGGLNFGWPLFEGQDSQSEYSSPAVENRDAPNPLYDGRTCNRPFFYFRELLKQDTAGTPAWTNPCRAATPITTVDVFLHQRPALDWIHGQDQSRFPAFSGTTAVAWPLGSTAPNGYQVLGSQFPGNTSTGGVWYEGSDFPAQYAGTYFHGDYGGQWIRSFVFDQNSVLREVREFGTGLGGVVSLATHPVTGGLYYIAWTAYVKKISYAPSTNVPPNAVATASAQYGASPLAVNFDGSQTTDSNGGTLTYTWDFGDGSPTATGVTASHTYTAAGLATFVATLTARDSGGLTGSTTLLISPNNAPPTATITSPADGSTYSILAPSDVPLRASLGDAQTGAASVTCTWTVILHHNNHTHQDPPVDQCAATARIEPLGCGAESYSYELRLVARDPQGLTRTSSARIYPDCPATDTIPPSGPSGLTATPASYSQVNLAWTASADNVGVAGYQIERCQGAACAGFVQVGNSATAAFQSPGLTGGTAYTYRVRAIDAAGNTSTYSNTVSVTTLPPPAVWLRVNAGGPAYTDAAGNTWSADTGYNTGTALTWPSAGAVGGTGDPELFRTERWDDLALPELAYSFAVPNGAYQVKLYFSEGNDQLLAPGRRVFGVQIEGITAFPAIDVFALAGARTALVRTASATVTDGVLNIVFQHQVEDPFVNAIEIISQSSADTTPPTVPGTPVATVAGTNRIDLAWTASTDASGITGYVIERCQGASCTSFSQAGASGSASYSDTGLASSSTYRYRVRALDTAGNFSAYSGIVAATTPVAPAVQIRVNAGGPAYTDTTGNVWSADTGYNGGNVVALLTSTTIAGTTEPTLYQTRRWDDAAAPELAYRFAVPNGSYQVRLFFAETNPALFAAGARRFGVDLEGQGVFPGIDVYAEVGPRAALVKNATVTVADGALDIGFRHLVEDPMVNAIEILSQSSTDTTPPTAPAGLSATALSYDQIGLSWLPSTDAVGVTGYQVERCQGLNCTGFAPIVAATAPAYTDAGLPSAITLRYRVRALDAAGNASPYSGIAAATTPRKIINIGPCSSCHAH
jgi:glucose/arabinose dehydrogenase